MTGIAQACLSSWERRHLQLSVKWSALVLTAVAIVSGFLFSPVWMIAAYAVSFRAGLVAGRCVHGGRSRMFDRRLAGFVAWDEVRPVLGVSALLLLLLFAATALVIFAEWFHELGDPELSLERGLVLLGEAFGAVMQSDVVLWALCAGAGPVAGAICGAMDGFWVGTVCAKRGLRFREAIPLPLGRSWSQWRRDERLKRRDYLRGEDGVSGR